MGRKLLDKFLKGSQPPKSQIMIEILKQLHQDNLEILKQLHQFNNHLGHLVNRPETNYTRINKLKHLQIGSYNHIQSKTSSSEDGSFSEDDLMSDTEYDVTTEKPIFSPDDADRHYYKGLAVTKEEPYYQNLPSTIDKGLQHVPLTGTDKTPQQNFSTDHDDTYSDFEYGEFDEQSTRNNLHRWNEDASEFDIGQCSLDDTITDESVIGYEPIITNQDETNSADTCSYEDVERDVEDIYGNDDIYQSMGELFAGTKSIRANLRFYGPTFTNPPLPNTKPPSLTKSRKKTLQALKNRFLARFRN